MCTSLKWCLFASSLKVIWQMVMDLAVRRRDADIASCPCHKTQIKRRTLVMANILQLHKIAGWNTAAQTYGINKPNSKSVLLKRKSLYLENLVRYRFTLNWKGNTNLHMAACYWMNGSTNLWTKCCQDVIVAEKIWLFWDRCIKGDIYTSRPDRT